MVVVGFAYHNFFAGLVVVFVHLPCSLNDDKSINGGEAGNYITIDSCKMNPHGRACDHKQSTTGR